VDTQRVVGKFWFTVAPCYSKPNRFAEVGSLYRRNFFKGARHFRLQSRLFALQLKPARTVMTAVCFFGSPEVQAFQHMLIGRWEWSRRWRQNASGVKAMKKLLMAASVLLLVAAAIPASAQGLSLSFGNYGGGYGGNYGGNGYGYGHTHGGNYGGNGYGYGNSYGGNYGGNGYGSRHGSYGGYSSGYGNRGYSGHYGSADHAYSHDARDDAHQQYHRYDGGY
jgi:hypothetical protein